MSRLADLHARLVDIQRNEPHHKRIGVVTGGHHRPPPMEKVCSRCPSRKACGSASLELAAAETIWLTKQEPHEGASP